MPDRWNNIQFIYKQLGINATFKTYPNIEHDLSVVKQDVVTLLSECQVEKRGGVTNRRNHFVSLMYLYQKNRKE